MILLQIAASLRNTSFCKIFRVLDLLVLSFFDCSGKLSCSLHVLCHVNMYKAEKLIFLRICSIVQLMVIKGKHVYGTDLI